MLDRQCTHLESAGRHDHREGADLADALRPGTALLVVEHGFGEPARILLDRPVNRLGRRFDDDILLDDVTVSRRHARIERRAAGFVLLDLDSINGTYLNGRRIDQAPLAVGDHIVIGKFQLWFLAGQ